MIGALGLAALALLWFTVELPEDPPELQSAVLVAEDGRELAVLSQEGQRFIVSLDEIDPVVVDALLSAEDRRFYDHGGVDPIGLTRALVSNLRHSGTQGGSTLTQQLVKNEYLTSERSLVRKAREAVLSVKLERSADKDEILERYLNTVYFGRGAYGIEAAARAYFDTSAADLDTGQAALLVGLLRSPETADPVEDMDEAVARRSSVLADMVDNDALTASEAEAIEAQPIEVNERTAPAPPTGGLAPHFVEWVRQQTVAAVGESALYGRGLRVVTTLDIDAQVAAETAVAELVTDPEGPEVALVALDEDGAIRAHVGSRDYDTLAVNLTRVASLEALRQAIIEQALPPGTKLPEDEIGEQFLE
ncbi:MAG: transglycosylase domain-containing protein, partial [Acidimicrobiales bacterium]